MKILSLFVFASALFIAVVSQGTERGSAAPELSVFLKEFGSSRGHFTQTRFSGDRKIVEQASGYFKVKSPRYLYWEYTDPFSQSITIDGEMLWLYDPDLEQVTRQDLGMGSSEIPSFFLTGQSALREHYDISVDEVRSLSGWTWFDLVPKTTANFLLVSIGAYHRQIAKIELQDTLGYLTVVEFHDLETKPEFDDADFEFVPPDGVEIIDALNGLNF